MRIKNVAEFLEDTAKRFPDKVAFSDGKVSLTFAELREQARRIASELLRRGYFKKPVLVAMEKEPRTIAAFMGCAYSGNFYTPLDLDMPEERANKIWQKLEPVLTISAENYEELAGSQMDEGLIEQAMSRQIDADLLYVMFTSGSTGVPKGVAVSHRAMIEYTYMVSDKFQLDEKTVHGQSVPLYFGGSVLPVYTTLFCGATDYLIHKKLLMFPAKLISFINENKCNTIYWVPTSYSLIAKSKILEKHQPKYLSKCLFVGEVMPCSVLNVWMRSLPNALFANLMGPTEIAGTCLHYIVNRKLNDDEILPVGITYSNTDVLIINDDNNLCKVNEIGELYIRSVTLGVGYYNDPERTAQAFVQNPLNHAYPEIIYRTGDLGYINERGEIMFVGRKDFQIKHAGHRVELGEIECAAAAVEGVEMCACVYDSDRQVIVLFYTGALEGSQLRHALKEKLQPYMIPGKVYQREALPRTATGKIDRVRLKKALDEER